MKLIRVLTVAIFCLFIAIFGAEAQSNTQSNKYKKRKSTNRVISHYQGFAQGQFKPYYSASFTINALNYFGDLAPFNKFGSTDISFTRPGFGGIGEYRFLPSMSVRAGLSWGRIKGDDFTSDPTKEADAPRYARNLSFRNDIKEFQAGLTYYISPLYGGITSRPMINAYVFAGIAVIHSEPKGKVPQFDYQGNDTSTELAQSGEWVKLRTLGTEGQFIDGSGVKPYSQFQLSIPVAVGLRMALPGPFDAGLEFGYRFLFTDYIDDVSGKYVDLDKFSDPLARIMSDRSTEPVAVWNGENRASDLYYVDITFPSGDIYKINGTNGTGRDGSVRGNPDQKDMIFMTTLKITYLIYPKTALSSKRR
ncbi:MAG: DUF6089 family protein [Bacteroidota bacterium]